MEATNEKKIAKRLMWLWVAVFLCFGTFNTYLRMNVPSFPQPWQLFPLLVIAGGILIPLRAAIQRHAKAANMKGLSAFTKIFSIFLYLWLSIGLFITIFLLFSGA